MHFFRGLYAKASVIPGVTRRQTFWRHQNEAREMSAQSGNELMKQNNKKEVLVMVSNKGSL